MKRTLPILLAILGVVTLTSLFFLLTRVGSWQSLRALDWRRLAGVPEDESVVVETVVAPEDAAH